MEISETKTSVRQVLDSVYEEVNWAGLAKNYLGKSRSWLYHKFSGKDEFGDMDRAKLREALREMAARINAAADRL